MALATLAAQDNPLIVDTVTEHTAHAARLTAHAAGRPAPAQSRSAQPEMPQTPDQHSERCSIIVVECRTPMHAGHNACSMPRIARRAPG